MFESPGLALLREEKARAVKLSEGLRQNLAADLGMVVQTTRYVDKGLEIAAFCYRQRYVLAGALGVIIASRLRSWKGGEPRIQRRLTLDNLRKLWRWSRKAFEIWQIYRQANFFIRLARRDE